MVDIDFVVDSFTDTDGDILTTQHTGELGATWSRHPTTSAGDFIFQTNRVRPNVGGIVLASGVAPGTTYSVEGVYYLVTIATSGYVCAWLDPTAATGYMFGHSTVDLGGSWALRKIVAGTQTLISGVATTPALLTDYLIRLEVGPGYQRGYVDNVLVASGTDTEVPATTRVGMRSAGSSITTTAYRMASFRAFTQSNDPPVVSAGADDTVMQGVLWTQAGTITDPDSGGWTATVDYDDGDGEEPLTVTGGGFTLSHTWMSPGTYTVIVEVNDGEGGIDTDSVNVTVTEAPTAGMYIVSGVTGTDASATIVTLT